MHKRISVIGTTCSGKSTLARQLADAYGIPYIELDTVFWLPGWKKSSHDAFREKVSTLVRDDQWVIEGSYSRVRDMVWERATTVIWLDIPFLTILGRLFKRTIRRVFTKEDVCNGNRETFVSQFLSKDSLFVWFFQSYFKNKKRYGEAMRMLADRGKDVVVLRSAPDAAFYVESIKEM